MALQKGAHVALPKNLVLQHEGKLIRKMRLDVGGRVAMGLRCLTFFTVYPLDTIYITAGMRVIRVNKPISPEVISVFT